jgi:hypothetical protein
MGDDTAKYYQRRDASLSFFSETAPPTVSAIAPPVERQNAQSSSSSRPLAVLVSRGRCSFEKKARNVVYYNELCVKVKNLQRKNYSTGSAGGGSGNNLGNSALVNNSFGFNFDSKETLAANNSPSDPSKQNDSKGDNKVDDNNNDERVEPDKVIQSAAYGISQM